MRRTRTHHARHYVALVLDALVDVGGLPRMKWGRAMVYFPRRIPSLMEARESAEFVRRTSDQGVRWETVRSRPQDFVVMFRDSMLDDHLHHGTLTGARVIYSMWSGQLQDERNVCVVEAIEKAGGEITIVHSGGHAYPGYLAKLVRAMAPRWVVPMPTLAPEKFEAYGWPTAQLDEHCCLEL